MTPYTETQMNQEGYVGKVKDPFLIELVRQKSLLGELEKRICDVLGLDKPWQHDLRFSEELDYKNAKNIKTGSLVFAKEDLYHSGIRLNFISDAVESFYKEKGFDISNKREEANKPSKELKAATAIPDDYHKFVTLDIKKNNEKYSIMISQGDEYHVSISDFP